MPRIAKPLTDTQIRNAKPKSKEYNLADGQGLYLRVKQSGSKEWVFNYYKPISGKRTNKGLGIYPNVSLKVARDKRRKISLAIETRLIQWHLSRQLEGLGRGLKLVDTALDTILTAEEIR